MKILLCTNNRHKADEFAAMFPAGTEMLTLADIGFTDPIDEYGGTFEENALIKARAVGQQDCIIIADDSGLAVDALGGAPGVHSAYYGGTHGDDEANNARLLRELAGVTDRTARFVCVIACILPNGEEFTVRGECVGRILEEANGEGGFGYDPLFWHDGLGKTFAQSSGEEKASASHRGVAIRLLVERLGELRHE